MAEENEKSFKDLGLNEDLIEMCNKLGWKKPTKIQCEVLPLALIGKDIIGLAETGSGKTAAFALPILQALLSQPKRLFALVLTPTRELALQISEQFDALGAGFGLVTVVIVGGVDNVTQAVALSKMPHILIATPGRLVDHLENTKGFDLKSVQYLVLDEADRILDMDFGDSVEKILRVIPKQRNTYLFSATMTSKVQKLQRCSLNDPIKIEISNKYQTVSTLHEFYSFIPHKYKLVYLTYVLTELSGNSVLVFCATCMDVQRLSVILQQLNLSVIHLHGQMDQDSRTKALNKFRNADCNVLISTDVASRGLDIPHVDIVINYDIPTQSKAYIHRVGRTARAGRSGKSITFVTQYDIELYLKIEKVLGKKLPEYPIIEAEALVYIDRINEAERAVRPELNELRRHGRYKGKISATQDCEEGAETRINIPVRRNTWKKVGKNKRR